MNQLIDAQRGVLNATCTAITAKTFEEQFTFDTTGNRLNYKRDVNGDGTFEVDQTRTHNLANEVLTISGGSTPVSHDRNGCMTKVPKPNSWSSAYTLVYDAWNRLISVSDGDTLVATYMYDARNHRIKTTVGTTVTLKYFNRNWQEIESVTNNVTTGYVYDFETGLMLYRNRYYHTGLGRFITRDPIGYNANDVNLYRYVESNPLVVSDPFGLGHVHIIIIEKRFVCR